MKASASHEEKLRFMGPEQDQKRISPMEIGARARNFAESVDIRINTGAKQ